MNAAETSLPVLPLFARERRRFSAQVEGGQHRQGRNEAAPASGPPDFRMNHFSVCPRTPQPIPIPLSQFITFLCPIVHSNPLRLGRSLLLVLLSCYFFALTFVPSFSPWPFWPSFSPKPALVNSRAARVMLSQSVGPPVTLI